MNRIIRNLSLSLLVVAAAAGFGLVTSCNITGGGASGATGGLNLLLTDGPTDDWQEVTVVLNSVSLHRQDGNSWEEVWTADPANPASGTINLVDLSGVTAILQKATIPVGTYNLLKLVIDTDPATMKLVDDLGNQIAASQITVVDPSGKGEIKVDLSPAINVVEGGTANLIVDFDLAHPLSIVNLDGKVVVSLKVRHKALPRHLRSIQFARAIGDITAAAADGASFSIKNLQESDLTFGVNANTIYVDADANAAGSFDGLKALVNSGAALVASNMNADGSLYARRVWYAASIGTLPQFTPEGLVRRVGENWLRILKKRTETLSTGDDHYSCDWSSETVFVDENTTWTFQDIAMGTGTSILRYIAKGFRVEVTFVDPAASPKVAASINVHSAHAEGLVTNATLDNFTFGWRDHTRTMTYSGIADHTFGWWFYGLPSGRSTVLQDFVDSVDQARSANLWVFAHAGLYWDQANTRWVVENLVLSPMKLHDFTRITTGYTAASGSMGVSTYDCWDESVPVTMNVMLDTTGDLQTVVGSFVWNAATDLVTFTLPVLPAEWEALLTPAVNRVKIWVRPVKAADGTFSWHAYSVIAYQFIR
ncbi:MAG: DUF4382 domain-containing protein [Candidatus Aminicenantes bacterium]|nr:DUF4382 domain-containing protein [Candidatus Aminicenantes bacterium]